MMENNGMYMPVAPVANGYGNDGMFGSGWMWFLLVWMAMFGWGNNGFGGGGTNNEIQRGFDQSALTNGINNIQASLCNGFAGVNNAINSGFAQNEIAANSRQMADMNQNFAIQQSIGNLQYAVATEACADRQAVNDAMMAVTNQMNNRFNQLEMQRYQDKIDSKNERIAELERQLTNANFIASQNAQTAAIIANNEAQTVALEQHLNPTARPAWIVSNPNCCNQTCTGCAA